MKRLYLFSALLLLSGTATSGEAPFTVQELTSLNQIAQTLESQCATQAVAKLRDEAAQQNNGSAPAWVTKLTSGGYCQCLRSDFVSTATPALMRSGTEADGAALVAKVANNCAAKTFKSTFPEICASWLPSLAVNANRELSKPMIDSYCTCAQASVDRITGDTLAETLRQSILDYKAVQKVVPPGFSPRPLSIVGPMQACATTKIEK